MLRLYFQKARGDGVQCLKPGDLPVAARRPAQGSLEAVRGINDVPGGHRLGADVTLAGGMVRVGFDAMQ